jgi:hypothetical protein
MEHSTSSSRGLGVSEHVAAAIHCGPSAAQGVTCLKASTVVGRRQLLEQTGDHQRIGVVW